MNTSTSDAVRYGRLSAFYFFYFALLGGFAPYWSVYLRARGFGPEAIGQLMALLMLARLIAPNIWGWLGDASQRRLRLVRLGSFLAFASFCGFYWAQGFWYFALLMGAYSFFWTAVLPQFEVITLFNLGDKRSRYSLVRLWGSIGFILAVTGLGYLFKHLSIDSLPYFLAGFLGMIWLASMQPLDEPTAMSHAGWKGFGRILQQPQVWAFYLINLLLQLSHGAYYTFYSIFMQSQGYGIDQVGLFWSLGVVAEVLLFLRMPWLLARFSLRSIILFSLCLTSLRWLGIPLLTSSLTMMLLLQLLHAFSFGAMHAASIEFIHRHFHGGHQGQGQALYSSIGGGVGGSLGALSSGYLYALGGGTLAFVAASLVAALAIPLARYGLRQPHQ